ncbi:PhzF family phenazine biosynthesis protein [Salinicola halophilus]|uniref:PhzF family phenazine biosynthesis protein n=1 Tax=Salinicola halophilus TaxID=184065 RepID=UPI000DA24D60|nr:PhzF family phenazine biosynthesis protein [Salinicola halophilus]
MSEYLPTKSLVGDRTGHRYVLLDVFTHTPFSGNPLAVFPEAEAIDEADMARIAAELNLSETVFITDRQPGRYVIRIFTPEGELPFAGHPSVGTAWLIRALGWHDGDAPLVLVENVGDVAIRFSSDGAELTTAQPLTVSEDSLSREKAAAILGLPPAAVVSAPVLASCGTPYHLVELSGLDALARIDIDVGELRSSTCGFDTGSLYAFVRQGGNRLRARMFAPLTGTPEDPATGSAAAPLIGYLSSQTTETGTIDWEIVQGVEMGRSSRIQGRVERSADGIDAIRIAGDAVIVGEGTLYL